MSGVRRLEKLSKLELMKSSIRKAAKIGIFLLLGATVAVCYFAYFYKPYEEARNFSLLQRMGSQTVETKTFIFNRALSGVDNDKTVILIHGAGTWLYSYRKNTPELSANHQVHSFDMPGHGYTKSKITPEKYDLDFMSSAILEYMDNQGVSKASLVGHSFGGGWALYFAQKHPDRVEKLVLLAPRALNTPYILEWELMKYPIIGEVFSKAFTKSDVRKGLENSYHTPSKISIDDVENIYQPLTASENRRAQYRLVRDSDWLITMNGMQRTKTPTLVIWGDEDRYIPPDQLGIFTSNMPNVRAKVLGSCGHSVHEECDEQVNSLILSFLQ